MTADVFMDMFEFLDQHPKFIEKILVEHASSLTLFKKANQSHKLKKFSHSLIRLTLGALWSFNQSLVENASGSIDLF